MIVLDTNVLSEPMRKQPEPAVIAWLNRQQSTMLYTTTVNVMELKTGVEMLPDGARKANLSEALTYTLATLVRPTFLQLDVAAAHEAARLASVTKTNGLNVGILDIQIAAIATVHRFSVATRNLVDFIPLGVDVINPWDTVG